MTDDLTPARVAEMAAAATPGPWETDPEEDLCWMQQPRITAMEYHKGFNQALLTNIAVVGNADPDDQGQWYANATLIAAAPAMATLIAKLAAENERLRGLMWHAWHEFNAVRARSGAPLNLDGMTTVDPRWWDELTEAFRSAVPEDERKPWPSEAARTALEQQP